MDHAKTLLPLQKRQHLVENAVHVAGAQGAPNGDHKALPRVQAQLFSGALPGIAGKFPPHRRTGNADLFRLTIVAAALLKAHQNGVYFIRQHSGGKAGKGVALMDQGGDVEPGSGVQHWKANIAAGADHGIGPEFLQDRAGLMLRGDDVFGRVQIVHQGREGVAPGDVCNLETPDLIAGPGHQVHLHLALGAEKKEFTFGHQLPQPSGHRKGGIHMSGGAAAGQYKFHVMLLNSYSLSKR